MESFEVSGVDNLIMLAWAWGVVKNQAGHGTAGAGEGVLSFWSHFGFFIRRHQIYRQRQGIR